MKHILFAQRGMSVERDNTRVTPITGIYVGDSQELQDANNRKIAAEGNVGYSMLRFTPYTRWATDALDIAGLSPDVDSPDFTDVTQGLSHVGRGMAKAQKQSYEDLRVGSRKKVGLRKRHPSITVTDGYKKGGIKFFDKVGSGFKHIGLVGFGGDIIQAGRNLRELYDAETNFQHVRDSVLNARTPRIPMESKGGKTHKPWGHRSILDNGWQTTKQLKDKKNVYGKSK